MQKKVLTWVDIGSMVRGMNEERDLTLEEIARRTGLNPGTLRRIARRGGLPGAYKLGGRWLVRRTIWDALGAGGLDPGVRRDDEAGTDGEEHGEPKQDPGE